MKTYQHILFTTDLSPRTEAAAQRAAELARGFQAQQMVILSTGSATHVIVETAREIGADLIVLASNEHDHALHLLRSTSGAVLDDAPCDVLALRADSIEAATARAMSKRRSRRTQTRRHQRNPGRKFS